MSEDKVLGSRPPRKGKPASVTVNRVPITWNDGNHGFNFFGNDSILFWVRPSLVSILQPLQDELGEEFYSRLIAYESSKGTFEDYHAMVSSLGSNFEEGFHNWGEAVSAAGWGTFRIESIDWEKKEAVVRIDNPWELKLLQVRDLQNHVPFLNGKVSGIFSAAFGTNCRARVTDLCREPVPSVALRIQASSKTLQQALLELNEHENATEKDRLRAMNNVLRRNERRLLDILETVGESIWESDLHLNLTYATRKMREVLGLAEDQTPLKKWSELVGEEQAERLKNLLGALRGPGELVECEIEKQVQEQDGRILHVRAKQLLDFNGNHIGYVGSLRDVTAERLLQEGLASQKKASEFAAKMATLGEMAGGMAHEINSPLASISLLSEQLLEMLPPDDRTYSVAQKINQTVWRIDRIIQGLRAFARDASQDPHERVPLQELVDETLELCRMRFRNNSVELKLDLTQGLEISCRPTQISQVLLNLLNNAHDAIEGLDEKWVVIEARKRHEILHLRVCDSGHGIAPDVQEKMMTPFFTTKEVGKGTGMGLSISKGIIESHGGRLYYDTASPRTCFVIELPLALKPKG